MSRSKPRMVDEIFKLKRELEEKDKEIKKLQRLLNNDNKKQKKTEKEIPIKEIVNPNLQQLSDLAGCPCCAFGKVQAVDLGIRKMLVCSVGCGYRQVIKNG
jgi:predicted RNase H-like nuclease (RuvC/YqgF family)